MTKKHTFLWGGGGDLWNVIPYHMLGIRRKSLHTELSILHLGTLPQSHAAMDEFQLTQSTFELTSNVSTSVSF